MDADANTTPLLKSPSILNRDGKLTKSARRSRRKQKTPTARLLGWLRGRLTFIIASTVLLTAVLLLGVLTTPAPAELSAEIAQPATVVSWANKAEACSGGGVAESMHVNMTTRTMHFVCRAPVLSWKSYATAAITLMALLFMVNNNPPDIVMLTATVCLLLLRIISQTDAWGGFSTPGVMAVAVLFVVAQGLQEVGVVDRLLRAVLGSPSSLFVAQIRLLFPVAVISAFMNNTPVVAMMIPIVESWSQRIGIPKTKFLIPLSFASMLGGMCTLIGTSTNLILAALVNRDDPSQSIGMFDMTVVGAPLLVIGVIYMAVASRFLLPDKDSKSVSASTQKIYQAFFVVPARSSLAGKSLQVTGLLSLAGLTVAHIERGRRQLAASEDIELMAGDRLLVEGIPEALAKLRRQRGIRLDSQQVLQLGTRRRRRVLVEVVLSRTSPLIGRSVTTCDDIMANYEAAIVAVRPSGSQHRVLSPPTPTPTPPVPTSNNRRRPLSVSVDDADPGASAATPPSPSPPRHFHTRAQAAPKPRFSASASPIPPSNRSRFGHSSSIQAGSGPSNPRTHHPNPSTSPLSPVRGGAGADFVESEAQDSVLLTPSIVQRRISGGSTREVFQAGDALVLEVYRSFLQMHMHSVEFALVRLVADSKPPRTTTTMDKIRAVVASLALIGMVIAAAVGVVSLLTAALVAALIMVVFKIMTIEDAFRAIRARVIIAIVCTFGIGLALQNTGVAGFLASELVDAALNVGDAFLLFSIFAVACIAGSVVSNNANVILMYPICVKASELVPSIPLKQFCIVLMMASSMSFMTPIGYQTNLMVMAPGGYKFTDYAKLGVLMQAVLGICAVVLTRHFIN